MKVKDKNLKSLDQFIDEEMGKRGTEKREEFEAEYLAFKLEVSKGSPKKPSPAPSSAFTPK